VPEPYQVEAAKFLVERSGAALFLDPGLRKTSCVLAAFQALRKKRLARRMLVVAPPRVCRGVWPAEVAKWREFAGLRVVHVEGPAKERLCAEEADVYCVSYNLLEWFFGATKTRDRGGRVRVSLDLSRARGMELDVLVLDEASKCRNTASLTFKILREARESFQRVWEMTGSPTPKSLLNLFGLMYLIDGGYSLGAYITHYRSAYFSAGGYGGFDYRLNPGAEKLIYERIAPFAFRLDAGDYVRLPKLVENVVRVELPPAARRAYDALEDDFIAVLESGKRVAAVNGGAASMKCRQVANGGLYEDPEAAEDGTRVSGPRAWAHMHDEKTQAVLDLLEELDGSPAMVVYDFHHDRERLLAALPRGTPYVGSGVSQAEGGRIVAAWNRGELPVLLVHPAAMAFGLNMQEGSAQHVVWHSLTWDRELYDQLVRRLMRSGSEATHVFSHLIVARDTVDEVMVRASRRKAKTQGDLFAALREYTLARSRRLRAA